MSLAPGTAAAFADAFRDGRMTPVDAVEAALARIDAWASVNAFAAVDREATLAMARASAARHARGEALGPLDGVPVSVKDTLAAAGWPTRLGSRLTPEAPSDADAPAVARLRAAGAVFVGKTTTPEFAWKGDTTSPLTGLTFNPWDPSRTAGGSSGGAAASVAAAVCPIALGSDAAGSIRIPAAHCGVFGLKPTWGRVPNAPGAALLSELAHIGPIARTVADAAAAMAALAGDGWAPVPVRLEGLRIGRLGHSGAAAPEEAQAAVERVMHAAAGLGAVETGVEIDLAEATAAAQRLYRSGVAVLLEQIPPEARDRLDPGLVAFAERARGVPHLRYLQDLQARDAFQLRLRRVFAEVDLLVGPVTPAAASLAREFPPPEAARWMEGYPFTPAFNLAQLPAASLPAGLDGEGRPLGVQLVAAHGRDEFLLAVCAALEARVPAPPFPEPSGASS